MIDESFQKTCFMKIKRPTDQILSQLESFQAIKHQVNPFSEKTFLKPYAPTSPLEQHWPPFHPALLIELDQRTIQLSSQLTPLMDQYWKRVKELSIKGDILNRLQQRQIAILMDQNSHNSKTDKLKDYFTALLFSRVFKNALDSHVIYKALHKKEWLQTRVFMNFHVEERIKEKEKASQEFKNLLVHPYRYHVKVPNHKKLLQIKQELHIQKQDWEHQLDEIYFNMNQVTKMFLHGHLFKSFQEKNKLANSELRRDELAKINHLRETYWKQLSQELSKNIKLFMPLLNQLQDTMRAYKTHDHEQYLHNKKISEDFIRKASSRQIGTHLEFYPEDMEKSQFRKSSESINMNKAVKAYEITRLESIEKQELSDSDISPNGHKKYF